MDAIVIPLPNLTASDAHMLTARVCLRCQPGTHSTIRPLRIWAVSLMIPELREQAKLFACIRSQFI